MLFTSRYPIQGNENGAALVVALVLVLVSTLLGVSAMQTSDVETHLANNTRYQQTAFRVAEAASDSMLTMANITTLANTAATSIESETSIDDVATVSSRFEALGGGPAIGFSLNGKNGFQTLKFMATATATINDVDSKSAVVQGIERLTFTREN